LKKLHQTIEDKTNVTVQEATQYKNTTPKGVVFLY